MTKKVVVLSNIKMHNHIMCKSTVTAVCNQILDLAIPKYLTVFVINSILQGLFLTVLQKRGIIEIVHTRLCIILHGEGIFHLLRLLKSSNGCRTLLLKSQS